MRFIGRVGHDATGDGLVDELTAAGVDVRVQRDGRTGTVVVLVEPGGVRTMYPDRAAAGQLGAIEPSWAEGVTWLHVPAYTWCTDGMGAAAADFAALVRRAGAAKLSVDVSSVAVVDEYGPARFNALLTSVRPDVVLATRDEAARLERDAPWLVVIKDGPRPVTIRYPEGSGRARRRGAGRPRRGPHRGRRRLRRGVCRRGHGRGDGSSSGDGRQRARSPHARPGRRFRSLNRSGTHPADRGRARLSCGIHRRSAGDVATWPSG